MRSTTGSFSLTSISALVLLSFIALIPAAPAQAKPKPAPTDKVELGVVVGAIKDALAESETYEVPAFPAFLATGKLALNSSAVCSWPSGCCSRHNSSRSGGICERTTFVRPTFA